MIHKLVGILCALVICGSRVDSVLGSDEDPSNGAATIRSCSEEPTKKSGPYLLQPFPEQKPFEAYCEQQKFGGGWLVFQRRFNGSVDFYRYWAQYKNGFGSMDREFWLGLETLYQLTKTGRYILAVELEGFDGSYEYAMYDNFQIGSEKEKYMLKELGNYNGTAGDALTYHKGMGFTTRDKDNDRWPHSNCALDYKGAWWYKLCAASNLNALYKKSSIESNYWKNIFGRKSTKMMIKEA